MATAVVVAMPWTEQLLCRGRHIGMCFTVVVIDWWPLMLGSGRRCDARVDQCMTEVANGAGAGFRSRARCRKYLQTCSQMVMRAENVLNRVGAVLNFLATMGFFEKSSSSNDLCFRDCRSVVSTAIDEAIFEFDLLFFIEETRELPELCITMSKAANLVWTMIFLIQILIGYCNNQRALDGHHVETPDIAKRPWQIRTMNQKLIAIDGKVSCTSAEVQGLDFTSSCCSCYDRGESSAS
ncbi:hypothetical protein F0562_005576 [Nyssa sinensis]|uniref:Uncharacterized protein n=1 Tax=Nyssa sinensis TaxID=561372 RepID=A0A5J5AJH5_9ASTE|nr:hypothetical protein F0562_005576 [Nyssa sinensis]